MRFINEVVSNCPSCPFIDTIELEVKTDHGVFPRGWFCNHRRKRGYILSVEDDKDRLGIRKYLIEKNGEPFPGDCPLPRVTTHRRATGQRVIDLNPGSPEEGG